MKIQITESELKDIINQQILEAYQAKWGIPNRLKRARKTQNSIETNIKQRMLKENKTMNFGRVIDGAFKFIKQHKDDDKTYNINDGSLSFGYGLIEVNPYDFEEFLMATDRGDEYARIGTKGEDVTIKDDKELAHYLNWCAEAYDCLVLKYD